MSQPYAGLIYNTNIDTKIHCPSRVEGKLHVEFATERPSHNV